MSSPEAFQPGSTRASPAEAIDQHFDSFTSLGASTGQASPALDNPSEWGQLVKVAHGGKTQIFERDLPNGQRVVTFVIWA